MRNFTKLAILAAISITAIFTLTSCEESECDTVGTPPSISGAEISGTIGSDSATIAVTASIDAEQICYTYYPTSDAIADEDKSWESVDIVDGAVDITINGLEPSTQYKAEIYATTNGAKSISISVIFTTADSSTPTENPDEPIPTIAVANSGAEVTVSTAQITVSLTDATLFYYTYYVEGSRPESPEMSGVIVESDGDYVLDLKGIPVNTESDQTFTFEAYAVNDYNTSESAFTTFQTLKSDILVLNSQTVNPLMAIFDIDIIEEACDGYAYDWGQTTWFSESYLLDYITKGTASIITEDGELVLGTSTYLKPATSYTLTVAPIAYNSDGTIYTQVGDAMSFEFTPPAIEIGFTDDIVEIVVDESSTTLNSLKATLYTNDAVSGVYYGCFDSSKVVDEDVDAAVRNHFANDYTVQSSFRTYDYSTSSYVPVESIDATFSTLDSGVEYYIFTIAITNDGQVGGINYTTTKTEGFERDSSIKPNVTIEAEVTTMQATIDFNGCDKVFIFNQSNTTGWYNEKSIENLFITDCTKSKMEYGHKLSEANSEGIFTYTEERLVMGDEYTFYYLGVDANGVMGDLHKIEYTTSEPVYESSARLIIRQTSAEALQDEGGATYVNLELNIIKISGATSYIYNTVHKDYINDLTDMEEWGDFVINTLDKKTSEESALTFSLQSRNVYVAFIPVDADGAYGTPQIFLPPIWESIPEDDITGDGGVPL